MPSLKTSVYSILFASCAVLSPVVTEAANVFSFQFYNGGISPTGTIDPANPPYLGSIVGGGTFASSTDLAPGTYDLNSLGNYSMSFSFMNGDSFTQADIVTPLTGVAVRITDLGGGSERLFFTEGSGIGVNGGPFSGALDLINGSSTLSFEPTFFGGNWFYQESGFGGQYTAFSVPEPASTALLGLGFLGFIASRRKSATNKNA